MDLQRCTDLPEWNSLSNAAKAAIIDQAGFWTTHESSNGDCAVNMYDTIRRALAAEQ